MLRVGVLRADFSMYSRQIFACSYGTDGAMTTGYDCIVIPGAMKSTITNPTLATTSFSEFCGGTKTFMSGSWALTKSVCSKTIIVRVWERMLKMGLF